MPERMHSSAAEGRWVSAQLPLSRTLPSQPLAISRQPPLAPTLLRRRGREFYRRQGDLESMGAAGTVQGPLTAVHSFVQAAAAALQEEQAPAGAAPAGAAVQPRRCSTWVLRGAERMLPASACSTAAMALASLRLSQLRSPKDTPSLALAVALWLNAAAFLAAGCWLAPPLLTCLLRHGVRGVCRFTLAAAGRLGVVGECNRAYAGPPGWMVLAISAVALLLLAEWERPAARGSLWMRLLHLERAAPRLLFRAYAAGCLVAANTLLLVLLFEAGALAATALPLGADPPGTEAAWMHGRHWQ